MKALPWLPGVLECLSAGEVLLNAPMSSRCTVRTGGEAAALCKPQSTEALLSLLRFLQKEHIDFFVLGKGANLLVGDKGFEGVVLSLSEMPAEEEVQLFEEGGELTLSAGKPIAQLLSLALKQGLVGAEFLSGIPGTLGGACAMNAGTWQGECMALVKAVELATAEGVGWVDAQQLPHGYRYTQLPPESIVLRLRFALPKGDVALSKEKIRKDLAHRRHTQPLAWPSFGSAFKNPEGEYAGRLIDSVGLKGARCGGAQISTRHANWIINLGTATALDIVRLMEMVASRIEAQHGIKLVPEVKRMGVFE
ncbi:MAG: UDP-N-acetylmuramate dehydrogenase [Cystobacterineae bacterium]|nr:UDP-N-acetylmuramate dehydrogenase [Cystobacterineae bacterium]